MRNSLSPVRRNSLDAPRRRSSISPARDSIIVNNNANDIVTTVPRTSKIINQGTNIRTSLTNLNQPLQNYNTGNMRASFANLQQPIQTQYVSQPTNQYVTGNYGNMRQSYCSLGSPGRQNTQYCTGGSQVIERVVNQPTYVEKIVNQPTVVREVVQQVIQQPATQRVSYVEQQPQVIEKIIQVKSEPQYIDKIIEKIVPQVEIHEKIVEIEKIEEIVTREEKLDPNITWIEKIVEVPKERIVHVEGEPNYIHNEVEIPFTVKKQVHVPVDVHHEEHVEVRDEEQIRNLSRRLESLKTQCSQMGLNWQDALNRYNTNTTRSKKVIQGNQTTDVYTNSSNYANISNSLTGSNTRTVKTQPNQRLQGIGGGNIITSSRKEVGRTYGNPVVASESRHVSGGSFGGQYQADDYTQYGNTGYGRDNGIKYNDIEI